MKKLLNKAVSFLMITALCIEGLNATGMSISNNIKASVPVTEHIISKGTSDADNPLKGMFGYSENSNFTFPHSMEWFYIPVSAVQTGMNTFNWTALAILK